MQHQHPVAFISFLHELSKAERKLLDGIAHGPFQLYRR